MGKSAAKQRIPLHIAHLRFLYFFPKRNTSRLPRLYTRRHLLLNRKRSTQRRLLLRRFLRCLRRRLCFRRRLLILLLYRLLLLLILLLLLFLFPRLRPYLILLQRRPINSLTLRLPIRSFLVTFLYLTRRVLPTRLTNLQERPIRTRTFLVIFRTTFLPIFTTPRKNLDRNNEISNIRRYNSYRVVHELYRQPRLRRKFIYYLPKGNLFVKRFIYITIS